MHWFKKAINHFKYDFEVSPHFNYSEFACKNGTSYPREWIEERLEPLCKNLERIREYVDKPIHILSAYRTPEYNRSVGGVKKSEHIQGRAVDIYVDGITSKNLFLLIKSLRSLEEISKGGLGFYNSFCHYDIRGKNVTWGYK